MSNRDSSGQRDHLKSCYATDSAYALSHGLQLGDALIAATALEYGLPVLTANTKHFGQIEGLQVEAFVP